MADKIDVYAEITNSIVAQLEKGVSPWSKPWTVDGKSSFAALPVRANGEYYRGVNVLILWSAALQRGYTQPIWMTFNQAKEHGGFVRKGEKATMVVYAGAFTKEVDNGNGETEEQRIPYMKAFYVFNVEQIDGLPEKFFQKKPEPTTAAEKISALAHIEDFFAKTGASVKVGGDRAFYVPSQDYIQMPAMEKFRDEQSYYATQAHETVHWTGAESRLDRTFGKRFGDEAYAAEELVAELGAAFLMADLGLSTEPREDHASYIQSWIRVLKNDKRAVFTMASKAQEAATYINQLVADADSQKIAA
jgi:antirestriction protein ArdC